jgi:hypothetical protein
MKTSQQLLRFTKIACAITALAILTACASVSSFFKHSPSPLPIEILDSAGGEVGGARAHESADRLYVAGHVKKSFGSHTPYAAHVDVQLVDKTGRVIAEKEDDIDPPHPKSGGGRSGQISYVASFPLSEARQAAKIVVRYHLDGHAL